MTCKTGPSAPANNALLCRCARMHSPVGVSSRAFRVPMMDKGLQILSFLDLADFPKLHPATSPTSTPYITLASDQPSALYPKTAQDRCIMFQAVNPQFPLQQTSSPPIDCMSVMQPQPQKSVATSGPGSEPKPRKLRASCDACSRAKVKCDKVCSTLRYNPQC